MGIPKSSDLMEEIRKNRECNRKRAQEQVTQLIEQAIEAWHEDALRSLSSRTEWPVVFVRVSDGNFAIAGGNDWINALLREAEWELRSATDPDPNGTVVLTIAAVPPARDPAEGTRG